MWCRQGIIVWRLAKGCVWVVENLEASSLCLDWFLHKLIQLLLEVVCLALKCSEFLLVFADLCTATKGWDMGVQLVYAGTLVLTRSQTIAL